MHLEPHAALGWTIGNVGGADHRLRKWCVIGALLPDIDGLSFIFGAQAYGRWHHTFGHNVFLWALFVGWVGFKCRSKRALLLSFLSFGSHLLTDAQFSGWKQYLFWPFSDAGFLFRTAVGLDAPINTFLVYASFAVAALLAVVYRRTPIDLFAPKLDRLLISPFEAKPFSCWMCQRPSNQVCSQCERPICTRHTSVKGKLRLVCPDCLLAGKSGNKPVSSPE